MTANVNGKESAELFEKLLEKMLFQSTYALKRGGDFLKRLRTWKGNRSGFLVA